MEGGERGGGGERVREEMKKKKGGGGRKDGRWEWERGKMEGKEIKERKENEERWRGGGGEPL